MYVYMNICKYVCMYVYMKYMQVRTYVCMRVCVCVCVTEMIQLRKKKNGENRRGTSDREEKNVIHR
jgi:hypothetical protein